MKIWSELDRLSREYDVLRHPFYLRWPAGTLNREEEELGVCAGQYRHAVPALESASRRAADLASGDDPARDLDETLTAVYARESTQPEIAGTKLAGRPAYGLRGTTATGYFELHKTVDRDHAAAGRDLIERRGARSRTDLTAVAERVWSGNWRLLDGVEPAMTAEAVR